MRFLLCKIIKMGGILERVKLNNLADCIKKDTDIVVNCSGIHAKTLGGVKDQNIFLTKGQTVIAEFPKDKINWAFLRHPPGSNTARPG